jgi:salicylate hydroxylase
METVNAQHGDLRRLLYDAAVAHGANVRFDTRVTSFNPDNRTATLVGGEVVGGDVIVGADGIYGLGRRLFEGEEPRRPTMNLFR